ncbi:MAG TPA: hypothetical protein VF950_03455 [Planctomycetota bacterium]
MGKESGTCVVCGNAVAAVDFDKGDAIRLLGKIYCGKCMKERVARSKSGDSMPDFRTPPPVPPKGL